jgi:hypothetical protein
MTESGPRPWIYPSPNLHKGPDENAVLHVALLGYSEQKGNDDAKKSSNERTQTAMVGGGAGGGRLIAGMLLRATTTLGGSNCAPWPLRTGMLGDSRGAEVGAGLTGKRFPAMKAGPLETRFPCTKDGVLETMRREERKGAGSERTCTDVGRRSCTPGGGGDVVWNEVLLREGDRTDGGAAGAVTERLITIPSGRGAGPDDARVDMRRGTTVEPSEF